MTTQIRTRKEFTPFVLFIENSEREMKLNRKKGVINLDTILGVLPYNYVAPV